MHSLSEVLSLAIIYSFHVLWGGLFGLGSYRSWLPLIGLGVGGLSLDLSSGYWQGCEEEVVTRSLVRLVIPLSYSNLFAPVFVLVLFLSVSMLKFLISLFYFQFIFCLFPGYGVFLINCFVVSPC